MLPSQASLNPALSRTAMIIDNDSHVLLMLSIRLRSLGFSTLSKSCGEDAAESLRLHTFDLIVTDLNMPRGDGLTLINQLRIRDKTPVILLTGYLSSDQLLQNHDNVVFLGKPFDSFQFAQVVMKLFPNIFDDHPVNIEMMLPKYKER